MSWKVRTAPRASSLIYGLAKGVAADETHPSGIWLLPANICPAVPFALMAASIRFEFVDISPSTFSLDVEAAIKRANDKHKTKVSGILFARSYGAGALLDPELARLRRGCGENIVLIDDRCLCVPEANPSAFANNEADAVIYSVGYGKVIDLGELTCGIGFFRQQTPFDAPAGPYDEKSYPKLDILSKKAVAERRPISQSELAEHRQSIESWIPTRSGPSLDRIESLISTALTDILSRKQKLNSIYKEGLSDLDLLPSDFWNWRFCLKVPERDRLLEELFSNGLFASAHYYPTSLLFGEKTCVNAARLHSSILNLFNDQHYSPDQAKRTVDIIRRHCEAVTR